MESELLRKKLPHEKYCMGCGEAIHKTAEMCPKCGYKEKPSSPASQLTQTKNKYVAFVLAFFLGGIGVHKFYLGNPKAGCVYILFCITAIPAIIALFESLIYLFTSEQSFNAKFNS